MTIVTVTIPEDLKQALEGQVKAGWFGSVSEGIQTAVKSWVKRKRITENGFTEEFEDLILKSAEEPVGVSEARGVLETDEDIENFMTMVRERAKKYGA